MTVADPATLRTSLSAMQNCEFSEQGARRHGILKNAYKIEVWR